jgi:hypothetical protein|tara:strand:+ start:3767 stop:4072 length:306 start_codon:yes stop_codon:yes gene_type:complete
METILQKIKRIQEELQCLQETLKTPPIQIGKIYVRKDTECLYTFIDWNGEIRLLNITNSHMWKPTLKSKDFRNSGSQKAEVIPYYVAKQTWTAGIEKFKLK